MVTGKRMVWCGTALGSLRQSSVLGEAAQVSLASRNRARKWGVVGKAAAVKRRLLVSWPLNLICSP